MNAICLNTHLKLSSNVVVQDLYDELVMLDLGSEVYFGLDEISARAWWLIEAKGRLGDVFEELQAEYNVARGRLAADLVAFAQRLLAKRLVSIT